MKLSSMLTVSVQRSRTDWFVAALRESWNTPPVRRFEPVSAEEMWQAGYHMDNRRDELGRLYGALPLNDERAAA